MGDLFISLQKHGLLFLIVFLLISSTATSQLSSFNLEVTKTDETCSGNGSLGFTVSNTTPQASVVYSIYLLPNVTNPIAATTENMIAGLMSGSYRVIATQSLNQLTNTRQHDVQILNLIVPLSYQVSGQPLDCVNGNITVEVSQGNPVSYEIISGPEVRTPQSSPLFDGLPVGEYVVRVNDACGDGIVQTFTLTSVSSLSISPFEQSCTAVNCSDTAGKVVITTAVGNVIYYPLQVVFTLFPPDGGLPIVYTQLVTSGTLGIPPNLPTATAQFNLELEGENTYSYSVSVLDACGGSSTYSAGDLVRQVSVELTVSLPTEEDLTTSIAVDTCNMVPPLTVQFVQSPVGFDPNLFNVNHPGPFPGTPIIYQSTPENEFPFGDYVVEVTDQCGNVEQSKCELGGCLVGISATPVCATFGYLHFKFVDELIITSAPSSFPFPLPYDCTSQIVDHEFFIQVPLGNYSFEGISSCNEPFKLGREINLPEYAISAENEDGCESNTGSIKIRYNFVGLEIAIIGVRIISAPAAFPFPLPFSANQYIAIPITKIEVDIPGLPPGDYVLEVTDFCGNIYPLTVTVPTTISLTLPTYSALRGCENGKGSIAIETPNRNFSQVIITAAPTSYAQALPHNVSFNIAANGKFYMNNLPEGNYTFSSTDVCGISSTFEVVVPGFAVLANEVSVSGNCGSFDLVLNHVVEQPYSQIFWLQKWNESTQQWVHPYTGVVAIPGNPLTSVNSFQVYNFATNFNFALSGRFRVVKVNSVYSNGLVSLQECEPVVLKEFDFVGEIRVLSASGILCADGTYNALISIAGVPPFTYKITTKDGQPFVVDNGNSNYFSALSAGTYNFQIQDACGNVLNRVYDITTLLEPRIRQTRLCTGENGTLLVPEISFLTYRWWKEGAPDIILSQTASLNFSPFDSAAAAGTYFVRIYSESSLSCMDITLAYVIPKYSNPKAGEDSQQSVCGRFTPVNLNSYLTGDYDNTGDWQNISGRGTLAGSIWDPSNVPYGQYRFRYVVNGFCDDFDESFVTINLKELPIEPEILSESFFCLSQPITLSALSTPGSQYYWTGPNNFTSNQQNSLIPVGTLESEGLYNVLATLDGCEASNAINLTSRVTPDFYLDAKCMRTSFLVQVFANSESFEAENATYLWTGPNNFSSVANPIDITGFSPGNYEVSVTHNGCSKTKGISIGNSFCGVIPAGLSPNGDGKNETFDLSGYGIDLHLKIFNRYGTLVYENENYVNQWYGQDYNNRILPDATYFYYIQTRSGEQKTGWVYLTR